MSCALVIATFGCVDRAAVSPLKEPVHRLAVAAVDPVPVGIAALEAYLASSSAAGSTAAGQPGPQRFVATRRLATLLGLLDAPTDGANSGPRAAAALYQGMLRELPAHPEREQILVSLAVSLATAGSVAEAQQIYRAVVCPSRYRYVISLEPAAAAPRLTPKPQDHSAAYWREWMDMHPSPLDRSRKLREESVDAPLARQLPASAAEEISYRAIYGKACAPEKRSPNEDRSGLYASLWLAIGDYHASESDPVDGPYALNRALEAYRYAFLLARASGEPMLQAQSLLALADTQKRAERHQRATGLAVRLMLMLDDHRLGWAAAKMLRDRAVAIMATSLTFVDFDGPPPTDPFIARPNTFDFESDAQVIEQKLSVGVERLQDTMIVPQDRAWTPAVFQAVAHEYRRLGNNTRNVLATLRAFLQAYPNHRSAPLAHVGVVDALYSLDAQLHRPTKPSKLAAEAKAERAAVSARYGKGSAWAHANARDSRALERAAELIAEVAGSTVP